MLSSIEIEPTYDQMCDAAVTKILAAAGRAIAARGRFSVALSGGTTPLGVYQRLASPAISGAADWRLWHVFWGDERWVSLQSKHSNYHLACEALLDHVPVDPARVHPMVPLGWMSPPPDRARDVEQEEPAGTADEGVKGGAPDEVEAAASAAALSYEATLDSELHGDRIPHSDPGDNSRRPPRLDLVLLGVGGDGHTASLFPGARALQETSRWVVAAPAPGGAGERKLRRLTLTLPVINAAREVLFLVSGAAKSSIVASVLRGAKVSSPGQRPEPLPAACVVPVEGHVTWLLDEDAAGGLEQRFPGESVT